jgi:hypothetical protein
LRNKQLTSEPFCHKRYGGVKKRQHGADSRPTKMLFWRNVIVDNN